MPAQSQPSTVNDTMEPIDEMSLKKAVQAFVQSEGKVQLSSAHQAMLVKYQRANQLTETKWSHVLLIVGASKKNAKGTPCFSTEVINMKDKQQRSKVLIEQTLITAQNCAAIEVALRNEGVPIVDTGVYISIHISQDEICDAKKPEATAAL